MNSVHRTKGFRKMIRTALIRRTVPKYVTAGDRACGKMMWEANERKQNPGPSDRAILAWAEYDLARELMGGFWELRAA